MVHPTRQALIDAGFALASTENLNRITVDSIVSKAGFAKGTFYVHFADRAAFLLALHVQFHEHLRDCIQQAMATGKLIQYTLAGQLRLLVNQRLPLERAAEAHHLMETRQTTGKIVLLPAAEQ